MSNEILKRAKDLLRHYDHFGADGDAESCLPVIRELVAALELSEWTISRLEKRAITPKITAFAAFGEKTFAAHRGDGEGYDLDGGTLHDLAIETGLLKRVIADEPCAEEGCNCAVVSEFPADCYRAVFGCKNSNNGAKS
jgi:hypothetical protein